MKRDDGVKALCQQMISVKDIKGLVEGHLIWTGGTRGREERKG